MNFDPSSGGALAATGIKFYSNISKGMDMNCLGRLADLCHQI